MSTETWLEEFYQKPAQQFNIIKIFPDMFDVEIEAIKHSLQKWKGLRLENLEKHEVEISDDGYRTAILDENNRNFTPGAENCALCNLQDDYDECKKCPLYLSRGGIACDDEKTTEDISPWHAWDERANPEPMIAELEMTLAKYDK